jgi:hypothetical protein
MALIPKLSTGIPTSKNVLLHQGTVNTQDTTAKSLFILKKGEMIVSMGLYGFNNSNAVTSASLYIGAKTLDNTGNAQGQLYGVFPTWLGTGYTSAPTVTFSGGGSPTAQATGTAVINAAGQCVGIQLATFGAGYTSAPTVTLTGGGASSQATFTAMIISSAATSAATFHPGIDVKTAATGKGQQYVNGAAGLYVPAPFDVMVTGIYADTGGAATSGGPWVIQINTYQPGPGEISRLGGFFDAVNPK